MLREEYTVILASAAQMRELDRVAIEENFALIGKGYAVDDSNQSGLTRTVRTKQSVNRALRYLDRYIIKRSMRRKSFRDVLCGDNIAHTPNFFDKL